MNNQDAEASADRTHESSTPKYTIVTNTAKFHPGQVVATPGVLALLDRTSTNPALLMSRHLHADWGDVCSEDRELNEQALTNGSRLMSVYRLVNPQTLAATPVRKRSELPTVWIITEAVGDDGRRASTCLLLPEEY